MRATTGRAVSAAIHQSLRDALAGGEPLTYQQLANRAGCTVRSVRNYLAHAEEIFGFPIQRSRDAAHRVVVQAAALPPPTNTQNRVAHPLDGVLASYLFPGSDQDSPKKSVILSLRGLPAYGRYQGRAALTWAQACRQHPRPALMLRIDPLEPVDVTLWPAAVVVHNLAGVILVGCPVDREESGQLATVDLDRVCDEQNNVALDASAGEPDVDLDSIDIGEALDLPFWVGTPDRDDPLVDVHVRFDPATAPRLRARVWHRDQRVEERKNGELDVRFQSVPLRTAASWVASYGSAVRVVGDKKLRKAVRKNAFTP